MPPRVQLILLACLAALLLAAPASASTPTAEETPLLAEINRVRAAHGARPLRVDWTLQRAARAHSADMIRRSYFAHGPYMQRLRRFGVTGGYVGENLAWGVGASAEPSAVVRSWLRSPTHRANLLRRTFTRIGVAAPRGTFSGFADVTVVTADFAGR